MDRFSTLSSPNIANARPAPSHRESTFSLIDAKRLVADRDPLRGITSPGAPKTADGKMEVAKGATEMTLRTKDRDKAGTTTYTAQAYYVVDLEDTEAEGNGGLQGLDEFSEYREDFASRKAAEAWVRRQIKAHPDRYWQNCNIDELRWGPEEYDWQGDTVLDAMSEHTHTWTYWIGTTKKLELQDEWSER